jgi:transcriptional regulator with XRE-family HTH domain
VKPDADRKTVERICRTLRDSRLQQGISQQQLAETAGISRTGLRHIESLATNPTLYSLLKIAKALNIDLVRLLEDS